MLSEIRERATGWIAWFIVILISIPFALWGVNEYFRGGGDVAVALVNGEEISQQAYRNALEDRRNAMRRMLGQGFDPELANSDEFKRGVLDDLINQQLLMNEAAQRGFRISDAQLGTYIREAPQFQREGAFDKELYERAVASYGFTTSGFESQLRRQSIIQQLRDGLQRSAFVTSTERERLLELALETRSIDYVEILPSSHVDEIAVSNDEIEQFYADNPDRFRIPERIKVQYLELKAADLAAMVDSSEDELRQAYEAGRGRFVEPEQRRVSHILIQVAEDADETSRQQALEKAAELASEARGGADFAELASANSQDPGSASQGGDLGVMTPGTMVKPFEDAARELAEGEVSDPVQTRFGYHVIKVTELRPPREKSFAEVREQIAREVTNRRAESLFIDRAETLRSLAYEQPDTLEPAAEALDLELRTSDWFSREEGTGIAETPRVRDAAFNEEVYTEGLNSDAVETGSNRLVVLRKLDVQPAARKPLEDVREDIEAELKLIAARERVAQMGRELLDQLNGGASWQAVLADHDLQAEQIKLTRNQAGSGLGADVVEEIFRTPPVADGQSAFGGENRVDGSYVLFQLTEVAAGSADQADDALKQRIAATLQRRRGLEYFLDYQQELRAAAEVQVFTEQL